MSNTSYVRWDDPAVEPTVPEEEVLVNRMVGIINTTQQHNFSMHRHYMRGTHVKTQAIVKGTLTIQPDLPPELAAGIAAPSNASQPHPIAIRFANEPSWLLDDRAPGPRGCGMKIFNVDAPTTWLDEAGSQTHTQDMTFNNAPVLELRDLPSTVEIFEIRERHFREPEKIPAEIKKKRKDTDLQMAPAQLPNHHFLAYTMYSQSAYRWGNHIVKYGLFPTGDFQAALAEKYPINEKSDPDQHSIWLQKYFFSDNATYDLRVQLCQNLKDQPVEDCGEQWDEQKYPYQTIGKVVIPKGQDCFDAQRRAFWDDQMKLNVWYGLAEHRPLGSSNRLRKTLYKASAKKRGEGNAAEVKYISNINEIP